MSLLRPTSFLAALSPAPRRRAALRALGVACAWLLCACERPAPPAAPLLPRPDHVVFVTLDTLRADHLPFYGSPRMTAPFLTELAERGIVFDRCIATSSHTGPSHASMFTSLLPAEHELLRNGEQLATHVATLAQLFQQQGYETAAFTSVKFLRTLHRGFDHFHAMQVRRSEETGRKVVDAALSWLEARPAEARSFLWLHLYDLHAWSTPNPAYDRFGPETDVATLKDEGFRRFLGDRYRQVAANPEARAQRIRYINSYDSRIHYVDGLLRELFERSEARYGPEQSRLWIVTSDHGEGLGAHAYMGHGKHIYEEQLRIPLLYHFSGAGAERLPGHGATRRVAKLVRAIDLMPTLAELVGASLPTQNPPLRGRSYAALLADPDAEDAPRLAFAQRRPVDGPRLEDGWDAGDVYSLQDARYKYILFTQREDEFYDLGADPGEHRNLLGSSIPNERDLQRELLARLDEVQDRRDSEAPERIKTEFEDELRALGYLQ